MMIVCNNSSPYYPKYYCNNGNNKENVYDTASTVGKESNSPSDNEDYSYEVK